MALLFADVVNKYNEEKRNEETNEMSNRVADFLDDIDNADVGYEMATEKVDTPQKIFVASIATEYYAKAQEDIANTTVGNKSVRRKNFKQVMQESFFYGSNRFGNNFIA